MVSPQHWVTTPNATYSTGALNNALAVFRDEATVRALAPDFSALTAENDGVVTGTTIDCVAAVNCPDRVTTVSTLDEIVSGTAVDIVASVTAVNEVSV
jgi:choline-glycine betaine transporter